MASPKRYKAINFDLDTHRLIEVFGEQKRRSAYSQIQRFLTTGGFDHKQWSGYLSIKRMSYLEMYGVIDKLILTCPWLPQCINSFDVTDFVAESDALDYISHSAPAAPTQTDISDSSLLV
jgi:virulence-associated protein VapD